MSPFPLFCTIRVSGLGSFICLTLAFGLPVLFPVQNAAVRVSMSGATDPLLFLFRQLSTSGVSGRFVTRKRHGEALHPSSRRHFQLFISPPSGYEDCPHRSENSTRTSPCRCCFYIRKWEMDFDGNQNELIDRLIRAAWQHT